MLPFPSDRKATLVEIFHLHGDPLFICGVHGHITGDMLDEVEKEAEENLTESGWEDGTYLFEVTYISAQTGEYGRVELSAYWHLERVGYRPIDNTSNQH